MLGLPGVVLIVACDSGVATANKVWLSLTDSRVSLHKDHFTGNTSKQS